jgi:copper oxidase (laccase) domain-containing protein
VAKKLRDAAGQPDVVRQRGETKWDGDLWAVNRAILTQAGISAGNIDTLSLCTFCGDDFYSYRRDQGRTGRQAGIIAFS